MTSLPSEPDADVVDLEDVQVAPATLAAPGGPFPTEHEGRPVVLPTQELGEESDGEDAEDGEDWPVHPVPPPDGWRLLVPVREEPRAPAPAYAAPATEPGSWFVTRLVDRGDHWEALGHGWEAQVRRSRSDRTAGLRLRFDADPVVTTAAGLDDVRVLLRRDDAPLAHDEADGTHVVGWVADPVTGADLPYEPHQAFGGYGPPPEVGADGAARLPVRWITDGYRALPPGPYVVHATLVGLDVRTASVALELRGR